tara:strand:+ start:318 stop:983 length:666 start_codon:yes stop_codon:yes gene_type:complete
MLNAVIFDFDGVILDSEGLHFKVFNQVLEKHKINISWDDYQQKYIGFNDEEAFKSIFKINKKRLNKKIIEDLIHQKAIIFEKSIKNDEVDVFPGVVQLIKSIPVKLPIGLCSGALRSDIEPVIKNLKIKRFFKSIVTAEDTIKSKPFPEPYLLSLKNLNIQDPSKTVAIEDTPAGINSAKEAGMKVLAVTNTFSSGYLYEADAIASSLAEVNRKTLEDLIY